MIVNYGEADINIISFSIQGIYGRCSKEYKWSDIGYDLSWDTFDALAEYFTACQWDYCINAPSFYYLSYADPSWYYYWPIEILPGQQVLKDDVIVEETEYILGEKVSGTYG